MGTIYTGGQAFPRPASVDNSGYTENAREGMTLLDYIAIHAPEPEDSDIRANMYADRAANPHGDSYKPPRRSRARIIGDLKYKYAIGMLEA